MNNIIPMPSRGLTAAAQVTETLTMSSREIAERCEKQHKNVKRDIETMCAGLEINALSFERIYKDSRNRDQTEYYLPKDLTLTGR